MSTISTLTGEPPFGCPVCQSRLNGPLVAREITPDDVEIAIQRCPNCGLHFTWPRLTQPQEQYLATTVEGWEAKYGAIDRGERLHDRHQNYSEELDVIRRYVPDGRLLDVGCNAGWLLGYLQRLGTYDLEGVEPSPVLAEIAHRRLNVPIHNCYLHHLEGQDATFDGLVATDVIEHVLPEEVESFVRDIRGKLKPGGYVFIKTPNRRFTALKSRIVIRLPAAVRSVLLKGLDVWDAKEHVVHWDATNIARIFNQNSLPIVKVFVPRPVETTNSPLGALIGRKAIYYSARVLGGWRWVPPFAQDIFLIARKVP